jgi:hypothetical protein
MLNSNIVMSGLARVVVGKTLESSWYEWLRKGLPRRFLKRLALFILAGDWCKRV